MIKTQYLSISILLSIISLSLIAQADNASCDSLLFSGTYSTGNVLSISYINTFPNQQNQFYGDWEEGDIYYTDGSIIKRQLLRYNSYEDAIMWRRESDLQVGIIPKKSIREVVIYKNKYFNTHVFRRIDLRLPFQLNSDDVFLDVLVEDLLGLYCYRKVKFIKNSRDTFYTDYQYFLFINNEFVPVKLRKKSLYSEFTKDEKQAFNKILAANKWKVKNETELIKAITQFNDLERIDN